MYSYGIPMSAQHLRIEDIQLETCRLLRDDMQFLVVVAREHCQDIGAVDVE
jgi:hypothetical protein